MANRWTVWDVSPKLPASACGVNARPLPDGDVRVKGWGRCPPWPAANSPRDISTKMKAGVLLCRPLRGMRRI